MNLKGLMIVRSVIFVVFSVITILLTKFVNFFEVEFSSTILLLNNYLLLILFGFFVFFIGNAFKQVKNKEQAKRMVSGE